MSRKKKFWTSGHKLYCHLISSLS
uniref:Uncharacterized protein n=1 Tax=Arundo donax TaxID=35708 RepID=A0A0A9BS60_ARUDO